MKPLILAALKSRADRWSVRTPEMGEGGCLESCGQWRTNERVLDRRLSGSKAWQVKEGGRTTLFFHLNASVCLGVEHFRDGSIS